jgi:hypothetical protein
MQIILDSNDYTDVNALKGGIATLTRLLDAASGKPTQETEKAATADIVDFNHAQAPSLQLDVLRLLAASSTGSLTSYEVAAALGMSQPDFAAKIRGTGKSFIQVQDTLYQRGWTFQNGKRVRVYTITSNGRGVAAEMAKLEKQHPKQ